MDNQLREITKEMLKAQERIHKRVRNMFIGVGVGLIILALVYIFFVVIPIHHDLNQIMKVLGG